MGVRDSERVPGLSQCGSKRRAGKPSEQTERSLPDAQRRQHVADALRKRRRSCNDEHSRGKEESGVRARPPQGGRPGRVSLQADEHLLLPHRPDREDQRRHRRAGQVFRESLQRTWRGQGSFARLDPRHIIQSRLVLVGQQQDEQVQYTPNAVQLRLHTTTCHKTGDELFGTATSRVQAVAILNEIRQEPLSGGLK